MKDWLQTLITIVTAALSGGVIWQGFKFFYPDLKQRLKSYNDAKKSFYEGLDPILKAADELYGKIYSLSKEDFAPFINPGNSYSEDIEHNKKYVVYLFGQFWAQLEFIRVKSQYTSLTQFKKGQELLVFIDAIESRQYRMLDRSWQRVVGETLIEGATISFKIMNLNQFIKNWDTGTSGIHTWAEKLTNKLEATDDKKIRQRILVFGVIVAALIDHFDPRHEIIHPNELYINKLNDTSKNLIRRNLFKYYLKFVKDKEKYYQDKER
jgi:hypothetical protein